MLLQSMMLTNAFQLYLLLINLPNLVHFGTHYFEITMVEQTKGIRANQEKERILLGSCMPKSVDASLCCRVISAQNKILCLI